MSGIEVLSRTQRIIVLPNTSVSIVKAGPVGPRGEVGPMGPQGLAGVDGETHDVEQHVPDYIWTRGEGGVLALAVRQDADGSFVDDDGDYTMFQIDAEGKLKTTVGLTDAELRADKVETGVHGLNNSEEWSPIYGAPTDTDGFSPSVASLFTLAQGGLFDGTNWNRARGSVAHGAEVDVTRLPAVALDSATLAALETIQIGSTAAVALDSATLAALETIQIGSLPAVALDSATLAALETIQIGSLPAVALDSATLAALENTTVTIDAASLASLETINVANIAGTEFAEDSPHNNGDAGTLLFAVRRDADTSSVSTDGDYAALLVDSIGRLKIKNIKDNQIVNGSLTIAISTSITATGGDANNGIIDLRGKSLVGIQMPSAWTAAALTFSASMDGGTTYNDLYDDSMVERSIAVVASRTITLDPTKFMGITHLKFRSGTGASAVNQGAARTIIYTTVAL